MTTSRATQQGSVQTEQEIGPWYLWSAMLGGLVAWIVRLIVDASIVGWACRTGWAGELVLYLVSAAAIAVTLFHLAQCVGIQRRARSLSADAGWEAAGLIAAVGILLNAIALALILAESASIPFIDTCASVL